MYSVWIGHALEPVRIPKADCIALIRTLNISNISQGFNIDGQPVVHIWHDPVHPKLECGEFCSEEYEFSFVG